jgi:hypothetical protein
VAPIGSTAEVFLPTGHGVSRVNIGPIPSKYWHIGFYPYDWALGLPPRDQRYGVYEHDGPEARAPC